MPPNGNTPRVSVIIPTYNNGRFIVAALHSVWEQHHPDVEIIVIDDGSSDDTVQVLQPYAARLRYVHQDNAGSAVARNRGLALARGAYVVFLDADDLLLPGKLAAQVPYLDARPELGAMHSGWRVIDAEGRTVKDMEPWQSAPRLDLETWVRRKPVKLGAMVFRRAWLERVGGFDPELRQSQDVDLMLRLALAGCRMDWLRRSTLCYRLHAESTIRRGASQQVIYINRVLDKFFVLPNVPAAIRRLERETRYYTNLWAAWHVYRHGYLDETAAQLRQVVSLTGRDPAATALDCLIQFQRWAARDAAPLREVESLVTLVSTVFPDASVAPALAWWHDVWRHYESGALTEGRAGLGRHRATPLAQILVEVERCISTNDEPPDAEIVEQWWQDLCAVRSEAASAPYLVTGVFLQLYVQGARSGEWQRSRAALSRAVRAGTTWQATPIWLRFMRLLAGTAWTRMRSFATVGVSP